MGTPALIGLGSNLDDRRAHLDAAVAALAGTPGVAVRAVSRFYETDPVGGPSGQGAFLNAAARLETSLDPFALLERLQQIERDEGRVRGVRWSARTLDLDLLLFGDQILGREPQTGLSVDPSPLVVPHRLFALRRFVLVPAAEVAPDLRDPVTRQTVRDRLAALDRRPSYLALFPSSSGSDRDIRLLGAVAAGLTSAWLGTAASKQARHLGVEFPPPTPAVRILADALASDIDHGLNALAGPSDGWLLTDFWFDAFPMLSPLTDADRDHILHLRNERPGPTFVVLLPSDQDDATDSISKFESLRSRNPIDDRPPVLVLGTADLPSMVAEILDACRACRVPVRPIFPGNAG